jgi:exosome complex exonuclease RRP6
MDMGSLYGAVHPISHNVKSRAAELLSIIKSAKEVGKDGPSMMDVLRPDSVGAAVKVNGIQAALKSRSEEAVKPASLFTDGSKLRSETSTFWGTAFGSSIWDPPSAPASGTTDLRLAVPMPEITSEVAGDSTYGHADRSQLSEDPKPQDSIATSTQNGNNAADEAFVIKSGRKRKTRGVGSDAEEPSGEYDIALNEQHKEIARAKAAKKAERRERKRAKRAGKSRVSDGNVHGALDEQEEEEEEEEVFDYSKADSVLHGKATKTESSGGRRQKPFDPYAKSADAPPGVRKMQRERAGKSFTFKS